MTLPIALPLVATAVLALALPAVAEDQPPAHDAPIANRAPLQATPMVRLPLGSVTPDGWLKRQLELQRDGLTGHAEEIYDALQPDSGWLGGDGESWERGPYYVKGLIALAHTLDDDELKARADKWIDWTLQSQRDDGFFGPKSNDDWWPRMVVLFYLRDHFEATGDERVMPFLLAYFRHQLEALPDRPLRDWGKARAGDNLDVVLWAYNRTGEPWLLDLAQLLIEQAYPWSEIYAKGEFYGRFAEFHPHHIVNVSQALKYPPVAWQLTGNPADRDAFAAGIANLERQYGRIDGQVSGTEMLSGLSSTAGVELCADVERILSNGVALTILGDAALGDQMEKVAYNSLPAHTTPEMTGITYYQFPNQVAATRGRHGFEQDYANANMPGPHSGFPCCCYNWHFGWPKLVQHMWAATSDGGLALVAYGPNRVTTTVADGTPVTITQETDYPFRETITLRVEPENPAAFPLLLRIPGWCDEPSIAVNGEAVNDLASGSFARVDREWAAGDTVELTFPMKVRTSTWINDSVGVERGALAYALAIDEQWEVATDHEGRFDEYAIRPGSPWNVALASRDPADFSMEERPVGDVPFASEAAPIVLTTQAKVLPEWGYRQAAGTVTLGRADDGWQPVASGNRPLAPDVPHRVKVQAEGDRLRVWVDDLDTAILDVQDGTFAEGGVGLRAYDTSAVFENITLDGQPVPVGREQAFGEMDGDNGQIRISGAPSAKALLAGPAGADFTFEADVVVAAGGNAGLIFRAGNLREGLDAYQGYYVGLSAAAGSDEDAAEPPQSPVESSEPTITVRLIPFGSTKLRVSYFPVLDE